MRANVYVRKRKTKKGEARYCLVVREYGRQDRHITLGPVSKKQAEERRVQILHELILGTYRKEPLVHLYFSELVEKFFTGFANGSRAPGTLRVYKESLRGPLKTFKGLRLNQITRYDVENFLSGYKVSGRTKNITLSVLRLVFQKAVEWKYLSSSPLDGIKRFAESSTGSRALTPSEINKLMENTTSWQKSVIRVMIYSGMRPGELSNLKLADIDWEQNRIAIVSDKNRKTKNRKSRFIPIHPDLKEELLLLKTHIPRRGGFAGNDYNLRTNLQQEYVFCLENGSKINCFRSSINRALKANGITGVSAHGNRKTFCSQLARFKVHPKVAQQLMGHSDITLTMKVYTEIDDDQLREGINSLPSLYEMKRSQLKLVQSVA